jgi:uncharacterized damage-inducible protein DinB
MSRRAGRYLDRADDPRAHGAALGDERATLLRHLADQRTTLALKCAGLDAEQLARRPVEPSTLSLLGLLRHLAEVERSWLRRTMSGEPEHPRLYRTEDEPDLDFDGAVPDPAVVEEAWRNLRAEQAFTDRFVDGAQDLGLVAQDAAGPVSLREVLVHLIEEYARHNGHADLLRERIDGRLLLQPRRVRYDDHRHLRVAHAVLAHRAEQGAREHALAPAAHHQQGRVVRRLDQRVPAVAVQDDP